MIAVIFEFTPSPGRFPDYMELVAQLKPELDRAEGFISLERFESITTPGKFVYLPVFAIRPLACRPCSHEYDRS